MTDNRVRAAENGARGRRNFGWHARMLGVPPSMRLISGRRRLPGRERIKSRSRMRCCPVARQTIRRFARLTLAHSNSLRHHVAVQAIFFAWYNLCRRHEAIKGDTPATTAGITSQVWTSESC